MAVFFTVKATNDSVVFNVDLYREMLRRLLGLRDSRHIGRKEVIINDPHYTADAARLAAVSRDVAAYSAEHRLKTAPNVVKVFFRYEPDHEMERINSELEQVIDDLSNTRDRVVLAAINQYPIMSEKAHTRPFERRWLNIVAAVLVPFGTVLYLRMWRYRLRLMRDLKTVTATNEVIIKQINEKYNSGDNK